MNSDLGHLCAHIGMMWDEWDDTVLQTQDSKFRPLRSSTLPSVTVDSHNTDSVLLSGEETFCFFQTWMPERETNPRSPTFQIKQVALTTAPGASAGNILIYRVGLIENRPHAGPEEHGLDKWHYYPYSAIISIFYLIEMQSAKIRTKSLNRGPSSHNRCSSSCLREIRLCHYTVTSCLTTRGVQPMLL